MDEGGEYIEEDEYREGDEYLVGSDDDVYRGSEFDGVGWSYLVGSGYLNDGYLNYLIA